MSLLDALILGLVQGLTEFLPVSSSGHLALAQALLGARQPGGAGGLAFELLLHVATVGAISVHFRRELWSLTAALHPGPKGQPARRVILLVGLASVATAAIGLPLRDVAERAFEAPVLAGVGLLATSLVLGSTLLLLRRRAAAPSEVETAPGAWLADLAGLRVRDALAVGAAQGLAVWPGLSRSGSTIVTGLWMGISPLAAARFSLLLALPAVGGGFLLELRHLEAAHPALVPWAAGFAVAFIAGWLSIHWLLAIVRRSALPWFAAYTAAAGLIVVILSLRA